MHKQVTILICPLDWGLGHASRTIPIIELLLSKKVNLIIAGSGNSMELLKKEYPSLTFVLFTDYSISYPSNKRMGLYMLLKTPSILYKIFREHQKLKSIIKKHQIDAVISDNRFGLFSKHIPTVYITHQLMVKCPIWLKFAEPFLYLFHLFFITKYSECWVPDYSGKINLSGDLSHKYPKLRTVYFIGPQSHLQKTRGLLESENYIFDLMVILSGPEPQRTILEKILMEQLSNKEINVLMILGKPKIIKEKTIFKNITLFPYLTSNEIAKFMQQSRLVFCRAAYSSIMDLCILGKKAILIPTPGQTEQEYLAKYFLDKKIFYSQTQDKLDICKAIVESEKYKGILVRSNPSLLEKRIEKLILKIQEMKKTEE
ncbi:MAG: hypothetical protein AUJ97_00910 [Bacteroidetes bacterium CG2_30_32_10]|nr:MAG: hypothetical protein AUJ97_00910 [Bacteroidetes bacterium CG2_30_32_10]